MRMKNENEIGTDAAAASAALFLPLMVPAGPLGDSRVI